ncbi:MAG: hypothetical protein RL151_393 [Bacteroidota bacterium]|jgi:Fe-Mn family superoxide dismutase
MSDRRRFLRQTLQGSLAITAGHLASGWMPAYAGQTQPHPADQAPLPYAFAALEPVIDKQTMELHYTKHAAAYAKNMKDAMAAEKVDAGTSIEQLLSGISKYSEKMRNNAGGHYNHELFWKSMAPATGQLPGGKLASALNATFGSFDNFKKKMTEAAMTRFGSGWAWLYMDTKGSLQIGSTPNQDNPLMDLSTIKGTPLLGLDVWEHAYYLKYQNRRAEYVEKWFNVVNWGFVEQRLIAAGK